MNYICENTCGSAKGAWSQKGVAEIEDHIWDTHWWQIPWITIRDLRSHGPTIASRSMGFHLLYNSFPFYFIDLPPEVWAYWDTELRYTHPLSQGRWIVPPLRCPSATPSRAGAWATWIGSASWIAPPSAAKQGPRSSAAPWYSRDSIPKKEREQVVKSE